MLCWCDLIEKYDVCCVGRKEAALVQLDIIMLCWCDLIEKYDICCVGRKEAALVQLDHCQNMPLLHKAADQ